MFVVRPERMCALMRNFTVRLPEQGDIEKDPGWIKPEEGDVRDPHDGIEGYGG